MWGDPDPDPGGKKAPVPQTSREIKDLKDQNEQQQLLIAQLKEMLRKEQSTVPQEKVEEYINTLSKAKAKKSRLKKDDSGSVEKSRGSSMDSNKHEKVNLMKQQMEENRAKLAERGMRQKDIEDMVTVLKAQLNDSSQQLINSAPVNLSSIEKNLDYNKNTGPEELYNILLVKEKKITDLLERVQKQETNILDLQENVKEKDSVLDARTKAISLMSENLSKKGKDTLDALDETKEQMRKMQENFIRLESEMKARQMILLNDLKSKNLEIADLQDENRKIIDKLTCNEKPESDNHELLIKDLKSKLDESKTTIEEFRNKINEFEKKNVGQNQNNELEKLKKQLDESNKNMIKVKAQHKSKIKDLNKKLDGFKKMSDANATIIQLQNEITKLNEKIAELEEEKGNMQLKMVESIESIKGSINSDDLRELQEKLERNIEETEEKDKIISLLESDIISLKSEIKHLNENISGFSLLKNEQVTSEIQSIQIEEQLEILETSNKELLVEIESFRKEKEGFVEKVEELIKEKLELTTKLDNYIQENMELIDKLEKLSAEKVSSAESIEIVENLTQQEKLELAAYQKNMDPNLEYPIKRQEEEPPAELNESVLQLTEEMTELLKKIEMFNMERKEVMIKLEALREENNQLSLKLNEVENNRDILAETYEQVQTEKDDLVKENEKMVQKLKNFENIAHPQELTGDDDTSSKLQLLQTEYEKILEENDNLKKSLKQLDAKIHEKDNLESELSESKGKLNELESKLKENLEEITNYQSIIEENKMEFINSSTIINQLQSQLEERETDIKELNGLINDLNNIVTNLQEDNSRLDKLEEMEKQVDEFKRSLNVQTEEFKEEIRKKDREIEKLKEKDQSVNFTIEEIKQKYMTLQAQLNSNSGTLDKQIEELSNKNKEQLEKMKKIAANLKKKTKALQELEEKYKEETEKLETDLSQFSTENIQLKEEISTQTLIMEQLETRIEELSKHKQEISLKQELSTSFYEEFDGSKESINEDKIKEMQLIIETNEADLQHYKERSQMLEEDLARLLEEKEHLLSKSTQLETKLYLISQSVKEKDMLEQEMDHKLQEVTANDEILVQRIEEVTKENKELTDKNRDHEELIVKLKIKIKKVQDKISQNKTLQANLEEQEHVNNALKQQLIHLEAVLKQNQIEYEEKQKENQKDYERIESDYQLQLEELVKCRNDLTFECEKLQDDVKFLKEREEELLMEVNESVKLTEDLRGQILSETVTNTVEDVITEAKATVNTEVNVTKEDLENKIKALEILLYNVDQEKEEVIQECSDMLNELTRLVYEKVQLAGNTNLSTAPSVGSLQPLSDLESQLLSPEDIADPLKLYQLEFEETDISLGEQNFPIEDKVGAPTKAYLTYQPTELESQILHSEDIETLNDPLKLQQLEFESCDPLLGQQSRPVVEKLAQPSKAYLTYQVGEAIGENDDGWGWGPEEARLEAEHQYRAENTPQVQALKVEVVELKKKLHTLQIKYGKLVKLCKELKGKLATKSKDKFFDLDETIQEELKTQIEQLEAKTKELSADLEKEKYDKSNLLKRVDVLTSANEKMLEMNQIQDSEIYRWKRKYDEIQKKLDWDNNSPKNEPTKQSTEDVPEDIEELKKLVQDLTVDNEELQALLNDQKQQRTQLERSKSINNEEIIKNLEESILDKDVMINKLTKEKLNLEQDFERIQQGIKILEDSILDKDMMINKLTGEKLELQQRHGEERIKHREEDVLNKQLQNEELQNEKTDMVNQFQQSDDALNREISSLRQALDNLTNESINPVIQELTQFRSNSVKELIDHFNQTYNNFENIKALELESFNQKQRYEELQNLTSKNISELQIELEELKQNNDSGKNIKALEEELFNQKQRYEDLQILTSKNILELQNELEEHKQNNDTETNIKVLGQELFNQKQKYEELQVLTSKNILGLQTELEELKQNNDTGKNIKALEEELLNQKQRYEDLQVLTSKNILQLQTELEEQKQKNDKGILEQELFIQKREDVNKLKEEIKIKQQIIDDMETKLVETITELEKNWAAQVDERGNTVAESWKYHLSVVESDFASIQDKLKNEINELEEKCNVLVNENNELRKNVDTEIKNEVDRISALQQQITDRQHVINELKQLLAKEEMEKVDLVHELDKVQRVLAEKEMEFISLKTLAKQFDEKRQVVEDIVKVLERNTSFPLSCDKQDILNEIQRQIKEKDAEILRLKVLEQRKGQNDKLELSTNQQIEQLKSQIKQKDEEFSAMQQLVYQSNCAIEDYKQKLEEFNPAYASLQSIIDEKNQQIEQLKDDIKEIRHKDKDVARLLKEEYNVQLSTAQHEIQQKLQQFNAAINEKNQQIEKLKNQIEHKDEDLARSKEEYITAQQEILNLQQMYHNSNYAVEDYKQKLEEFNPAYGSLQSIIDEKNQQIEDQLKEIERNNGVIDKLKEEYYIAQQNLYHQIEDYKLKLEQLMQSYKLLQTNIDEKNQQINILNQQLQLASDNKETEKLESELLQTKDAYILLQQSFADCQQQLFNITQDLATKSHEFETVTQQLLYSQQNVDILQEQINNLNQSIHIKEQDYAASIEKIEKTRYKELENHYEEILSAKDLDIQTLRSQIAESVYNTNENLERVKQLEAQIREFSTIKAELETKMLEQTLLAEEESKQLNEMRGIIEEQVAKIEELKKELFEKSNDYDSLIAEMDISRKAITQQPTASGSRIENPSAVAERPTIPEDDLSEPVNRAELDLALYMLHQRDVRCEELTVELTHLLEERDTLQLRLSNAIREKEEFKRNMTDVTGSKEVKASSSEVSPGAPKTSRSSEIFVDTELASEPSEKLTSGQELASKLSELKTVGYKRDKTFVDEQQQRRMQQISIMQQHIKEAAKLPPEAAAKLVDASYTLSRDVQSPSKVLLNWLWGRSTPRVNDT